MFMNSYSWPGQAVSQIEPCRYQYTYVQIVASCHSALEQQTGYPQSRHVEPELHMSLFLQATCTQDENDSQQVRMLLQ